jgi:hypothetical protein
MKWPRFWIVNTATLLYDLAMSLFRHGLCLAALGLVGCGEDALSFCARLEKVDVAKNCRPTSVAPEGPLADAKSIAAFDMTSGGEATVYAFASEEVFTAVSTKISRQGPHGGVGKHGVSRHQGYVKSRIMVMLSDQATERDEAETRKALGQEP